MVVPYIQLSRDVACTDLVLLSVVSGFANNAYLAHPKPFVRVKPYTSHPHVNDLSVCSLHGSGAVRNLWRMCFESVVELWFAVVGYDAL